MRSNPPYPVNKNPPYPVNNANSRLPHRPASAPPTAVTPSSSTINATNLDSPPHNIVNNTPAINVTPPPTTIVQPAYGYYGGHGYGYPYYSGYYGYGRRYGYGYPYGYGNGYGGYPYGGYHVAGRHLSPYPMQYNCPYCKRIGLTMVTYEMGTCAWVAVIILFLAFFPLSFLPCAMTEFQDAYHYCSGCRKFVGMYQR